jgi:hypothetical protein
MRRRVRIRKQEADFIQEVLFTISRRQCELFLEWLADENADDLWDWMKPKRKVKRPDDDNGESKS